jgi:hypothetical protein
MIHRGARDLAIERTGVHVILDHHIADAWQKAGNPEPLGMPLQYMVSGMAVSATNKYPNETVDVAFNPVGQVVGQSNPKVETPHTQPISPQDLMAMLDKLPQVKQASLIQIAEIVGKEMEDDEPPAAPAPAQLE